MKAFNFTKNCVLYFWPTHKYMLNYVHVFRSPHPAVWSSWLQSSHWTPPTRLLSPSLAPLLVYLALAILMKEITHSACTHRGGTHRPIHSDAHIHLRTYTCICTYIACTHTAHAHTFLHVLQDLPLLCCVLAISDPLLELFSWMNTITDSSVGQYVSAHSACVCVCVCVMIHTHRCYCINTGWMTDGDRSHEG